jgi:hypothetical protein
MRYSNPDQVIDRVQQTELLARVPDLVEDQPTCPDCGAGLGSSSARAGVCTLCYANRLLGRR